MEAPRPARVLFAMALLARAAVAAVDPSLVGTWQSHVASEPATTTLDVFASGRAVFTSPVRPPLTTALEGSWTVQDDGKLRGEDAAGARTWTRVTSPTGHLDAGLVGLWTASGAGFVPDGATIEIRPSGQYEIRTSPPVGGGISTFPGGTGQRFADGQLFHLEYALPSPDRLELGDGQTRQTFARDPAGPTAPRPVPVTASPSPAPPPESASEEALAQAAEGARHYRAGDMERAATAFLAAARGGSTDAQLQIGWHYEKGAGVKRDLTEALFWYGEAARRGSAFAQTNLGNLHSDGRSLHPDFERAWFWYRKAAAQDDRDALYGLARMYEFGRGVPQDRKRAGTLYSKAAALGHPLAGDAARQIALGVRAFQNEAERDAHVARLWVETAQRSAEYWEKLQKKLDDERSARLREGR